MNPACHRTHLLKSDLLMRPGSRALDADRPPRRLWWLIIGLVLPALFLIGVVE